MPQLDLNPNRLRLGFQVYYGPPADLPAYCTSLGKTPPAYSNIGEFFLAVVDEYEAADNVKVCLHLETPHKRHEADRTSRQTNNRRRVRLFASSRLSLRVQPRIKFVVVIHLLTKISPSVPSSICSLKYLPVFPHSTPPCPQRHCLFADFSLTGPVRPPCGGSAPAGPLGGET